MAVQIECEVCRHRFPARSEYFGNRIFCPSCRATLVLGSLARELETASVPSSNQRAPVPPPPPAPPRAPVPSVPFSTNPSLVAVRYAGFWIRVVAWFLDTLILLIPNLILTYLVPILGPIALQLTYKGLCLAKWDGQTIGKKACGIKVLDQDLRPVSMGQAFGRTAAEFLSGLILCIGYLMAAFHPKKRALHDEIAGTLHVYA